MIPKNKNIIDTLNLLSLLFRANKQKIPKLHDEELYILTVKKEFLENDNLSLSVFSNTLQFLADKGYLSGVTIFDSSYHEKLKEAFSDEVFYPAMEKLSKNDGNTLNKEQKLALANSIMGVLPPHMKGGFDIDDFLSEKITLVDLFEDTKRAFNGHNEDIVAKVILYPFRSIEKLLKQMNAGKLFDEVLDADVWYNDQKCEFHIKGDIVSTSYQDKPNIEHYILRLIPEHLDEGVIWYDEVEDRTSRSIKDALLTFVAKNKKLEKIFTVHSSRLEFDPEAFI